MLFAEWFAQEFTKDSVIRLQNQEKLGDDRTPSLVSFARGSDQGT